VLNEVTVRQDWCQNKFWRNCNWRVV